MLPPQDLPVAGDRPFLKLKRKTVTQLIDGLRETGAPMEEYQAGRVYTIPLDQWFTCGRADIPKGLARCDLYEMEHAVRCDGRDRHIAFWWPDWVETNDVHVESCHCQICRWHKPRRLERVAERTKKRAEQVVIYDTALALEKRRVARLRFRLILASVLLTALALFPWLPFYARVLLGAAAFGIPVFIIPETGVDWRKLGGLLPIEVGDGRINRKPWCHLRRDRPHLL